MHFAGVGVDFGVGTVTVAVAQLLYTLTSKKSAQAVFFNVVPSALEIAYILYVKL